MNKNSIIMSFIILIVVGYTSYSIGSNMVRYEWSKDIIRKEKELNIQKNIIRELEQEHIEREKTLLDDLNKQRFLYEETISSINSDSNSRLLKLEERANYYKRRYEDKHCDNSELINKTIRIDQLAQEGSELLRELEAGIILRDSTIDTLLKVIKNDRDTINSRR